MQFRAKVTAINLSAEVTEQWPAWGFALVALHDAVKKGPRAAVADQRLRDGAAWERLSTQLCGPPLYPVAPRPRRKG